MTTSQSEVFAAAAAYEQFMGRWSRRLAPLLTAFASVEDGDSVLEVGSGTGALSLSIAESCPMSHVAAFDRSINYVKHARASARSHRVRFFVGDAQALALIDDAFDKTLSLLVLNFVPDPAKA